MRPCSLSLRTTLLLSTRTMTSPSSGTTSSTMIALELLTSLSSMVKRGVLHFLLFFYLWNAASLKVLLCWRNRCV
ncbi:BnaA05g33150D [Brassica napus]|uniref:BnaA05g33150D protein n=1 Tax=Brassica napus TaxID=3708 RepID=A0A078IJV4_BRANA|nr:BnaA05g33150D [Brassica napus]